MTDDKEQPEQLFRLLAPLRAAFLDLNDEERRRISDQDPIIGCVALLQSAAQEAGHRKLARTLRFHQTMEVLASAAGGLLDVDEFAKRLRVARGDVLALAGSGLLLAVDDCGVTRYPSNQVSEQGELVEGLAEVLRLLGRLGISGWMALDVLNSPVPQFGLSPLDLLHQERKIDVLNFIASLEHQGAA